MLNKVKAPVALNASEVLLALVPPSYSRSALPKYCQRAPVLVRPSLVSASEAKIIISPKESPLPSLQTPVARFVKVGPVKLVGSHFKASAESRADLSPITAIELANPKEVPSLGKRDRKELELAMQE